MGQRADVCGVGAGTVRIGSPDRAETGGEGFAGCGDVAVGEGGGEGMAGFGAEGEERETVFVGEFERRFFLSLVDAGCVACWFFFTGMPDTMGGGRSSPSAALRDSCLAKSEACHHSRNLRANMEVGRRSRRLESRRGYMADAKVLGFQMLFVCPGRAPGREGGMEGACSARAMAR